MSHKTSTVVGWVLLVLEALVLGIPSSVLVVECVRHGQFPRRGPWAETVEYFSVATWLVLLVVWLAVGHLNPRRARVAWYCLLISLAAMLFVYCRPELQ